MGCICSTGPFKFRWSRGYTCNCNPVYCHNQIRSAVAIFPWLYVWVVVTSYYLGWFMLIPRHLGFCFHYYCAVCGVCKSLDTLRPVGRIHFFGQYTRSLSLLRRYVWTHWAYNMLDRYIQPSVPLRLIHPRNYFNTIYKTVCFQLTYFSFDVCENIYTSSWYNHQIGNIKYQPLFVVRSWDSGMHLCRVMLLSLKL